MTAFNKKKFFLNFSSYAFGNGLILAAGLFSFPLFTRTLSVSEYGAFSLLNAALSLLVCLSKGGLQNTINRFWKSGENNSDLVATSYSGAVICFLLITVITLPAFYLGWFGAEYSKFTLPVLIACYLIVLFEVIRSISNNVSIIQKKAFQYSCVNVAHKYLRIILPFIGILIFSNKIFGIAVGFLMGSFITMSILLYRQEFGFRLRYDKKLLTSIFIFGFPLMLNELIDQLLSFCDRFFLAHYLNASAVGMYSAAYNLSNNVQVLLITSMGMTTAPILLERFNTNGFEDMKRLLRRCITWYCLLGGAVIALFASIGPDLLVLLASSKYREAGSVMLPVLLGVFFYGMYSLSTSTLFFRNQTKLILFICFIASIINIFSNWILVPRHGIFGAALAALVSYLFLGVVGIWLVYNGEWREFFTSVTRLIPAVIMACVLNMISIPGTLSSILIKTALGVIIWSVASYLQISEISQMLSSATTVIRNKWLNAE
ncbi:oligosaccharide flippase family protein [Geobacter argillaceus]|uniref:O-antigen/teichoic acid export membrane protein n=1 Tax=Geobacter argillaceus TaxID=345631 RepID=A0A562VHQ4_9BACT|nr:oligosaccharide flippase family protein [Geobacter argillaceus]TWJ17314.1 O-antigen/teichoic acid export membrane protein [Geobacter argillaceus]